MKIYSGFQVKHRAALARSRIIQLSPRGIAMHNRLARNEPRKTAGAQ
jgi:hypothetical protein